MKAESIIQQLAIALPNFSDKFTTNFDITSLTRSGTTVTAVTSAAHGLVVGKQAIITGAKTPISIGTLIRAGVIGTLISDSDHDMTENFSADVELSGSTEAEFNGTFTVLTVPNRRTITFTMDDSGATVATGSPLLLNGSSFLKQYNGLKEVDTVPSPTSFTYEITDTTLFSPAAGTIKAKTEPRISGAISIDRIVDAYTKQAQDEYWAFVVLGDVFASKSRKIESDATDNQQRGNEFRQQIIQPFTIVVAIPTKTEIAARAARDEAEDLLRPICRSVLFKKFDSQLFVGAQNPSQFVDHGFTAYNTAFYLHSYNFESTADITFDDTIGYDESVAFRDIISNMTIDLGTREDPLTANIDLDEDPDSFLPPELPGLKLWTRYNQGITVTGSGVSQWDDASGNGNHLKQATDTNRPAKQGDGSILFDGVDNFLKADAFTLVQPETIYVLINQKTWTITDFWYDGQTTGLGFVDQFGASPEIIISAGLSMPGSVSPVVDTYNVVSVIFNSTSSLLQLNNAPPITGNAHVNGMNGFTLGSNGAGTGSWSNIEVKEIIVFAAAHDAATRAKVINYLAGVGELTI